MGIPKAAAAAMGFPSPSSSVSLLLILSIFLCYACHQQRPAKTGLFRPGLIAEAVSWPESRPHHLQQPVRSRSWLEKAESPLIREVWDPDPVEEPDPRPGSAWPPVMELNQSQAGGLRSCWEVTILGFSGEPRPFFTLQKLRNYGGGFRSEEAAAGKSWIVILGFFGEWCKMAPMLCEKTIPDPWGFLIPAVWRKVSLTPGFNRLKSPDLRCHWIPGCWMLLVVAPVFWIEEWLWYRDGFDIPDIVILNFQMSRAARPGEELEGPGSHRLGQK